jgi:hypothetical protein
MQRMREAFPWDEAPRYVLCDGDAMYGTDFTAMTVWNERSLRRMLHSYFAYYQRSRTHLALVQLGPA